MRDVHNHAFNSFAARSTNFRRLAAAFNAALGRQGDLAPSRYSLKPYDASVGDIPFAFGVDIFCPRFPYDLGDAIEHHNGLAAFARRVREAVTANSHQRPHEQELKIIGIKTRLTSTQMWGGA